MSPKIMEWLRANWRLALEIAAGLALLALGAGMGGGDTRKEREETTKKVETLTASLSTQTTRADKLEIQVQTEKAARVQAEKRSSSSSKGKERLVYGADGKLLESLREWDDAAAAFETYQQDMEERLSSTTKKATDLEARSVSAEQRAVTAESRIHELETHKSKGRRLGIAGGRGAGSWLGGFEGSLDLGPFYVGGTVVNPLPIGAGGFDLGSARLDLMALGRAGIIF